MLKRTSSVLRCMRCSRFTSGAPPRSGATPQRSCVSTNLPPDAKGGARRPLLSLDTAVGSDVDHLAGDGGGHLDQDRVRQGGGSADHGAVVDPVLVLGDAGGRRGA